MCMHQTALTDAEGSGLSQTTVLVTGATSGLGRECARVLALRGARVLMPCRSLDEAKRVLGEFRIAHASAMAERCQPHPCDLSSIASVHAYLDGLSRDAPIDMLFLNAGVFAVPRQLTDEGFEYTLAANYLGHFLLLYKLAMLGILSENARIVVTLSESVHKNPFSRADIAMIAKDPPKPAAQMFSSPNSKVLLALMMGEFLRRISNSNLHSIRFNAVDPGPTLTDNVNQGSRIQRMLGQLVGPILFKKVDQGAAPLVWAASSSEAKSGVLYTAIGKEARLPKKCTDPETAARAWLASEAALDLPVFDLA